MSLMDVVQYLFGLLKSIIVWSFTVSLGSFSLGSWIFGLAFCGLVIGFILRLVEPVRAEAAYVNKGIVKNRQMKLRVFRKNVSARFKKDKSGRN